MRFHRVSVALASLMVFTNALAVPDGDIMEDLREVPQGWKRTGAPSPSKPLAFRIAMAQPDGGVLFEQTLYDLSTPDSLRYGQHLKRDALKVMLRPAPAATSAVLQWLKDGGIPESAIDDEGEWINFHATVSRAESLLRASFSTYQNRHAFKTRTLQYSVPRYLHRYIDMIQPTTRFGQIRPQFSEIIDILPIGMAQAVPIATACNATITPACLKLLYDIVPVPTIDVNKAGFIGISGFLGELARYHDLTTFESEYAPYLKNETFDIVSIDNGITDQTSANGSTEANLDVQYGLATSYPVGGTFYSTGGLGYLVPDLDEPGQADDQNEPYLDLLTYLLALPDGDLPTTLTTSYGEDEQSVPESYANTVCNMFGQLGARGVSVIFSSGDTGVGSACQTNDGKNTTRFLPTFPAACPYVTSVGATHYVEPESAVSFSSGGFSDRFVRPAYQDAAVNAYLEQLGSTWEGLYNRSGRGFPDVAAQGTHFHVIDKGTEHLISGTSCSAPTFAGQIAAINAARLSAGKSGLGFLNPWIYSMGYKGLTDITHGGSTGCTGVDIYSGLATPFVPYASWNATKGWDPVSGYGSE